MNITDPMCIPQWLEAIHELMGEYSCQYGGAINAMEQYDVIVEDVRKETDPIDKINKLNEIVEDYEFTDNIDWSWYMNNARGTH